METGPQVMTFTGPLHLAPVERNWKLITIFLFAAWGAAVALGFGIVALVMAGPNLYSVIALAFTGLVLGFSLGCALMVWVRPIYGLSIEDQSRIDTEIQKTMRDSFHRYTGIAPEDVPGTGPH